MATWHPLETNDEKYQKITCQLLAARLPRHVSASPEKQQHATQVDYADMGLSVRLMVFVLTVVSLSTLSIECASHLGCTCTGR